MNKLIVITINQVFKYFKSFYITFRKWFTIERNINFFIAIRQLRIAFGSYMNFIACFFKPTEVW